MQIKEEKQFGPTVLLLLNQHLDSMRSQSPPESVHALDVVALKSPDITFWTGWEDKELLGCGALRQLNAAQGEIKSMCTAEAHLRKGVAAAILEKILVESQRRRYARVSLETGALASFEPARRLYSRFGFVICDPFAEYTVDPNSLYMSLELELASGNQ